MFICLGMLCISLILIWTVHNISINGPMFPHLHAFFTEKTDKILVEDLAHLLRCLSFEGCRLASEDCILSLVTLFPFIYIKSPQILRNCIDHGYLLPPYCLPDFSLRMPLIPLNSRDAYMWPILPSCSRIELQFLSLLPSALPISLTGTCMFWTHTITLLNASQCLPATYSNQLY